MLGFTMKLIHTGIAITCLTATLLAACGGTGGGAAVPASTYSIGGTITGLTSSGLVLQNNWNDYFFVPTGGNTFVFGTPLGGNSTYRVKVLTQPVGQNCTVVNSIDTVGNTNVTNITVTCVTSNTPKFAYVANAYSASVSAFSINIGTGELSEVNGSPFMTGDVPISIAVDPSGKFAYVANANSNNVSAYAINASTGALTEVNGSPFTTGWNPRSVTVDPSGRFLYVANMGDSNVSAYNINPGDGSLHEIIGSPFAEGAFAGGTSPSCITIDPWGKFAYVVNQASGDISIFHIDVNTGALTAVYGRPLTGVLPFSLSIDHSGRFAYVSNSAFYYMLGFTINPSTGELTEVAGNPYPTGGYAYSTAIDPSGTFLYVTNQMAIDSNTISTFAINASTGALTEVAGSPFTTLAGALSIAIDPSGNFAYVANANFDSVSAYSINANTGSLTEITGSPFAAGASPASIAITR
jgi:6-phosphogluconolactonase